MSGGRPGDFVAFLLGRSGDPVVFGHRGYSAVAPENTLAAFSRIKEHSVEGVEFDIHQCGSGEIVVIHDNDLERVAGVPLSVAEASLSQLVEHDVGRRFSNEFTGERIPTLEQVFDLLGNTVVYDIEIKHNGVRLGGPLPNGIEERLGRLIRDFGLVDCCFASSFDPLAVRRLARIAPEIPRAVIYADSPNMPRWLRHGQGRLICGAAILKPQFDQVTTAMVEHNKKAGRAIVTWTVDDAEDARSLARVGVSGIVTNDPGTVVAALR